MGKSEVTIAFTLVCATTITGCPGKEPQLDPAAVVGGAVAERKAAQRLLAGAAAALAATA